MVYQSVHRIPRARVPPVPAANRSAGAPGSVPPTLPAGFGSEDQCADLCTTITAALLIWLRSSRAARA